MIDEKLTKSIVEFLDKTNPSDDEILEGANILLRINRNRMLFQTICRKPQKHLDKLRYELNKHIKYRLDGLTHSNMKRMVADVLPKVGELVKEPENTDTRTERKGKREDHDNLPDSIKALWDKNVTRYNKMKEIYATCETIEHDCDRYEYVKLLDEAYKAYKADMAEYDNYAARNENVTNAAVTAKDVSNARAYISKTSKKFDELKAAGESTEALAAKIQERVDTLIQSEAALSDELRQWLVDNDFRLNETE